MRPDMVMEATSTPGVFAIGTPGAASEFEREYEARELQEAA